MSLAEPAVETCAGEVYIKPRVEATYTAEQILNFEEEIMYETMLWSKTTWTEKPKNN